MYGNRTDTNILSRPFGVLVNLRPRTLHVPGSNLPRASGSFLHFYTRSYFQSYISPPLGTMFVQVLLHIIAEARAISGARTDDGRVALRHLAEEGWGAAAARAKVERRQRLAAPAPLLEDG